MTDKKKLMREALRNSKMGNLQVVDEDCVSDWCVKKGCHNICKDRRDIAGRVAAMNEYDDRLLVVAPSMSYYELFDVLEPLTQNFKIYNLQDDTLVGEVWK